MIKIEEIKSTLQKNSKYWIVFTGDSTTSCEWVHPNWRDILIYVLQNELTILLEGDWKKAEWGIKGFNFAYDGATTKDIIDHINDILLVKPDMVISLMGANDPVMGISVEQSIENITEICDIILAKNIKVVWSNSIPAGDGSEKNSRYQPYAEGFMEIKNKPNFFKIDMFNKYKKYPTKKFFTFLSEENPVEGIKKGEPDLHHPNQLGNAYIAKIMLKEIFDLDFDPDLYITETLEGKKYPSY